MEWRPRSQRASPHPKPTRVLWILQSVHWGDREQHLLRPLGLTGLQKLIPQVRATSARVVVHRRLLLSAAPSCGYVCGSVVLEVWFICFHMLFLLYIVDVTQLKIEMLSLKNRTNFLHCRIQRNRLWHLWMILILGCQSTLWNLAGARNAQLISEIVTFVFSDALQKTGRVRYGRADS